MLLFLGGGQCSAQSPEESVRTLARRVADAREVPQNIAVEWRNISSLPEPESIVLREAFLKELALHRVVVGAAGSAAILRASLRETPTDFLLVARILNADSEELRMTPISKAAFPPVMPQGSGLRLVKQLLWQQPEPILDAGEFAGAEATVPYIFLLKPDAVAIYWHADERWSEVQELGFSGYKYVSRDQRGALRKNKDGEIVAALPGLNCVLRGPAVAGERWTMHCSASGTAGAGVPANSRGATNLPPVSVAKSALDSNPEASAISSSCDVNSWRLLAGATDWTQPDRLLLVGADLKRDEAVASLDFPGPLRRVNSAEDARSALAVIFNLSSGSYEVYRVTLACGR